MNIFLQIKVTILKSFLSLWNITFVRFRDHSRNEFGAHEVHSWYILYSTQKQTDLSDLWTLELSRYLLCTLALPGKFKRRPCRDSYLTYKERFLEFRNLQQTHQIYLLSSIMVAIIMYLNAMWMLSQRYLNKKYHEVIETHVAPVTPLRNKKNEQGIGQYQRYFCFNQQYFAHKWTSKGKSCDKIH